MDAARLRAAFPVLERNAYLNAGTCGPLPAAAHDAAAEAWRFAAQEGRSTAFYQRLVPLAEQLRERYAGLLGAPAGEVALTGGTSDGCGHVVAGLELGPGDEVVTADDEHPGLTGPLIAAREQRGATIRAVPLAEIPSAISENTRLVACSHVSWHSGALAPVADIVAAARAHGNIPVLLDGAQGVGAVDVDVHALGCDFYAGSGQKWLCGPEGTGMLWVSPLWREQLAPETPGYLNLAEPGAGLDTEPWPDARAYDAPAMPLEALTAALTAHDVLAQFGWDQIHARATSMAATLADRLRDRGLTVAPRGATTLVTWESPGSDELPGRLAEQGIVVRNLPGTSFVRASVGAWNDESDLERLLAAL